MDNFIIKKLNMSTEYPEFWDDLYRNNKARWNLGSATPAFSDLLKSEFLQQRKKLLILGSGHGHDAVLAAKNGFNVTAVDFSDIAIAKSKDLAKREEVNPLFIKEDFFELKQKPDFKFEAIFDYVTYCSFNPVRRNEYSDLINDLLLPGGIFIIILFPIEKRKGGPPFAVDPFEATKYFSEHLSLVVSTTDFNSIKPRKGREILQIYQKQF